MVVLALSKACNSPSFAAVYCVCMHCIHMHPYTYPHSIKGVCERIKYNLVQVLTTSNMICSLCCLSGCVCVCVCRALVIAQYGGNDFLLSFSSAILYSLNLQVRWKWGKCECSGRGKVYKFKSDGLRRKFNLLILYRHLKYEIYSFNFVPKWHELTVWEDLKNRMYNESVVFIMTERLEYIVCNCMIAKMCLLPLHRI